VASERDLRRGAWHRLRLLCWSDGRAQRCAHFDNAHAIANASDGIANCGGRDIRAIDIADAPANALTVARPDAK
tara:strand:- start:1106 stop:1327 length:222 start_codon:yes stop_codon:yes gene_type:complete